MEGMAKMVARAEATTDNNIAVPNRERRVLKMPEGGERSSERDMEARPEVTNTSVSI